MGLSPWLLGIIIGISTNFDSVGSGLAYGRRKSYIPWLFCIITSITSLCAFVLGSLTGVRIAHFMSPATCNLIGSVILVCIGLWIAIQAITGPDTAAATPIELGFSEMMFIAVAQAMSDLSVGFGAGFAGLNILSISLAIALFSFVFLAVPMRLGARLRTQRLGKRATFISGILLVVIGLFM